MTAIRIQLRECRRSDCSGTFFLGPTKVVRCGHDVGREAGEPWRVDSPPALAPNVPHNHAGEGEQDRQPEDELGHQPFIRRRSPVANGLDASLAVRAAIVTTS
jgi:hypothetical protein